MCACISGACTKESCIHILYAIVPARSLASSFFRCLTTCVCLSPALPYAQHSANHKYQKSNLHACLRPDRTAHLPLAQPISRNRLLTAAVFVFVLRETFTGPNLLAHCKIKRASESARNSHSISRTATNQHSFLCARHPGMIALSYFQCNF